MEMMRQIFMLTQKILVISFLFLVYMIGFGLTFIFVALFKHNLVWHGSKNDKTFWKEAKGYDPDIKECMEQS